MCFLIRSCGSASSAALAESHWWGEHEVRRGRGGGGWKVTRSHCIFMDESPFLSSSYSSSFGCLGDYQRWRHKSWNAVRPSAVKIISPILSIHSSFSLWPSFIPTSCEWVTAAREYKGTGSVEEAERRQQSKTGPWRLDVRGMLLSKLYHSVTQQDQSPQTAPKLLLFFFFCAPSVSWCSLFILTLCLTYCDHTSHLVRYWTGRSNLRRLPCPSVLEFVTFLQQHWFLKHCLLFCRIIFFYFAFFFLHWHTYA